MRLKFGSSSDGDAIKQVSLERLHATVVARAQSGRRASARRAGPPSSSYAGKKSPFTGFWMPPRVRSSSSSFRRRTPHSSASFAGFLSALEAGEAEGLDEVGADQVGLAPAGQLEDAAPDREDAPLLVARPRAPPGAG